VKIHFDVNLVFTDAKGCEITQKPSAFDEKANLPVFAQLITVDNTTSSSMAWVNCLRRFKRDNTPDQASYQMGLQPYLGWLRYSDEPKNKYKPKNIFFGYERERKQVKKQTTTKGWIGPYCKTLLCAAWVPAHQKVQKSSTSCKRGNKWLILNIIGFHGFFAVEICTCVLKPM